MVIFQNSGNLPEGQFAHEKKILEIAINIVHVRSLVLDKV
jgi:hypothetical protein